MNKPLRTRSESEAGLGARYPRYPEASGSLAEHGARGKEAEQPSREANGHGAAGSRSLGNRVEIFDTTLRDGTQREGLSLSCSDKLRVAALLDELGVHYIEGGWPGSNPKDVEFFQRARETSYQRARIVAFGSTRRANIDADQDPSLRALVDSQAATCCIFGKSWTLHVEGILNVSREENLAMIHQSVSWLCGRGREVIYDAEHFFDGYRADPDYALATLIAARAGGATTLVLCDTNGGTMPWEVESVVKAIGEQLPNVKLGIHAHDDAGCAVANTLAAVRSGASHVQGTVNGYGERCGNANLCAILPNLELKLRLRCLPEGRLRALRSVSRTVAEIANLAPNEHMPYVGRSAFTHKGGVHVSAMRRSSASYEHVRPEAVGNVSRVVVSELSGRSNLLSAAEKLGICASAGEAADVLRSIKDEEARGYAFEAALASVATRLRRASQGYRAPFTLREYEVTLGRDARRGTYAQAIVEVEVGETVLWAKATGAGPVQALDAALRRSLRAPLPEVDAITLCDYKVRILDGRDGTDAVTRVLVDSRRGQVRYSTVGASKNIIEASCAALVDAFEHGLALPSDDDPRPERAAATSAAEHLL